MTDYGRIMREIEAEIKASELTKDTFRKAANATSQKNNSILTKDLSMAKVTAVQILHEAAALKEKKSKDYQGGKWTEEDYFPFGETSYVHMIHTKYLRMRNIVEGGQETNFEALEDTLVDMAVYCAMFAAYLENKNNA